MVRLLLAAGLLLPLSLGAQTAAESDTATPATTEEEGLIVLSPFEVNTERDSGYVAENSLGGTRLNTPIKDLPFTVNAITEEFIRDIGARSIDQALQFASGVSVISGAGAGRTDTTVSVRGLPSNFFLRDGTAIYRAPNWAMVDRIEVVRGASAIVYGQTQPGGVVNLITKRPDLTRRFGRIEQTIGQYENYETRFDYNLPLIDNVLGFRLSTSFADQGGRREGYDRMAYTFFPSLTYKPFEGTTITLQFTKDRVKTDGILFGLPPANAESTPGFNYLNQNYQAYYDSFTPAERIIRGLPNPNDLRTARVGGPAQIFRDNPYDLNPSGSEGRWHSERKDHVINIQQRLIEYGTGVIESSYLQFNFARIEDRVRSSLPLMGLGKPQGDGVNSWADARWEPNGIPGEQWGGEGNQWAFGSDYNGATTSASEVNQLGYYHLFNENPPGPRNMAGSGFFNPADASNPANANVIPLAGPNTYFWYPMTYFLENTNEITTLDNVTTFDFDGAKLRLLVGAEFGRQEYFDPGIKGYLPDGSYNRTTDSWSSTAWGPAPSSLHWNLPNWGYGFTGDAQNPGSIWGSGADRKYRGWSIWNADTGERRGSWITGDDIDSIILENYYGITQRIKYLAFYSTAQLDLFDRQLQLLGALRYTRIHKEDYRVQGRVPEFPQEYSPLVPQVGMVWNITPDINLYASFAQNYWYEWSRGQNQLNESPPQNEGTSYEFGTKFALFDGRLSGNLAVFESTYQNLTWKDYTFNLTAVNPSRYPGISRDTDGDNQPDRDANGVVILYPEYGLDRFDGEARARGVELNLQTRPIENWDVVLSYSFLDTELLAGPPWAEGQELSGVPDHMVSLWNKYVFATDDDILNGFEVGFGLVYNSPVFVGNGFSQTSLGASDVYWQTPVFLRFDAMIARGFKLFDLDWRAQVNVRNIANRTNWTPDANLVPDGQGREFYGTLTVEF